MLPRPTIKFVLLSPHHRWNRQQLSSSMQLNGIEDMTWLHRCCLFVCFLFIRYDSNVFRCSFFHSRYPLTSHTILYPSYYFIVRFIVMLGLPIHCLRQCFTIISYIIWIHTHPSIHLSHVYALYFCTSILYRCITFDPSYIPLIRHILSYCRRYLYHPSTIASILHPSIAYLIHVNGVLIHPFINRIPFIHRSIIDTTIISSSCVFVSSHR